MMKLQDQLKDACEAGGEISFRDDYSGRGMRGRSCVGITGSKAGCMQLIAAVIGEMIDQAVWPGADGERHDLAEEAKQSTETLLDFSQDSMGYDVILYWETLQPLEDERSGEEGMPEDFVQEQE